MNAVYSWPSSPLADAVHQMQQRWADDMAANLDRLQRMQQRWADEIAANVDRLLAPCKSFEEATRRWAVALDIVRAELPKRGWYLTGSEPITVTGQLAFSIKANDWGAVDQILLEEATRLRIKKDLFQQWLSQHGVPDYCIARVGLVLDCRESGDHEVATIVGVAVIDELCYHLYGGRTFTTKRNNQPRPQVACPTSKRARELSTYAKGFVETFGLIHEDIDMRRVEDDDYFNRAAILHGLMRREYGPKDSAKVFMLLMFLVFGLEEH
jgi:hypothetical protein